MSQVARVHQDFEPGHIPLRELDAQVMREAAYHAVVDSLKKGQIRQPEAVTALRHAYQRAERHAHMEQTA